MSLPSSILCYGRDITLLQTRRQVLERAGFATEIASSRQDFERCLQQYSIDLVLLCHSLDREQCERAKKTVHDQAEPALLLLLGRGFDDCSAEGTDALVDAREGPAVLLGFITSLLNQRGHEGHLPRLKHRLPSHRHTSPQSSRPHLHR